MGFSRQEYWSGLPFPSPGDLPNPRMEPTSPALIGRFFSTEPLGKPKWTDRWALFSKLISQSSETHTYLGPHTLTHIPHTHTHPCTYPLHARTHVSRYPCFQAREHTYTHTPLLVCTPCPMHTFILEQDSRVLQAVVLATASLTWGHPGLSSPLWEGLSGCSVWSPALPASPYSSLVAPGQ